MPAPTPNQERGEPPLTPSRRSLRGIDWFVFFVADVQTGFGPFVSVFLTVLNCKLILGAKSFGETSSRAKDTDQTRVFGKKGWEVLSIEIR